MRREKIGLWLSVVGQFLIIPVILLYLCEWAMLDEGYHMMLHDQQGAAQSTGLTQEGVTQATHVLCEYLRGRREDINLTAPVYGVTQEVFNAREKAHMIDVKALFNGGRRLRAALFAVGGLLIVLGITLPRKNRARQIMRARFFALFWACVVWVALLGALGILCAIDFNAVFLRFHALFFDNDLWLLDPRVDLMIRLLPEAFFEAVAKRTALWTGGGLVLLTALSGLLTGWRGCLKHEL